MKTAVIGGGISGLSAAYYLRKLSKQKRFPLELTLFESEPATGGVFETVKADDLVFELGPDSFITSKPWAIELVRELGLESSLIQTNEENRKTFVFTGGRLKPLPHGFFLMAPSAIKSFLISDFFSLKAKLRVLFELFIPRKNAEDEDLHSFVTRRFGMEVFQKAAQPLISGIYTSDPRELSLRATMPQFLEMEKAHGSVVRGLLKKKYGGEKDQSGARYSMFLSLKNGMRSLIEAIQSNSEIDTVRLNSRVSEISYDEKWNVKTENESEQFDSLVVATPSYVTSSLLKRLDPTLGDALGEIEYASSVVVNLVFKKNEFINKPEGFGVVIPSTENMNLLACSFYTDKFPARNRTDRMVVRCFLGGKLRPDVINWDDDKIYSILMDEMEKVFGIRNEPADYHIKRYRQAMPQFKVGHNKRIAEIINLVLKHRGLALCGNIYNGVGIPDCIKSGKDASEKIFNDMNF